MARSAHTPGTRPQRHRTATRLDPYLADAALKEPCLCPRCQAVYHRKRWRLDAALAQQLAAGSDARRVLCPACRKVADHYADGVLTLRGEYLWAHEAEIRHILEAEADRVTQRNPLERILRTDRGEEALVIETTGQKLAEHLGRILQRAHSGDLRIDWEGDACRVEWRRLQ